MAQVDGINGKMHTVKIGDSIGFKDDIEQYGTVTKVAGAWITIEVFDGVTGDRNLVDQHESDCWYEG